MGKIGEERKKLARVLIGTRLGKIRNAGRNKITFPPPPYFVRIINIYSWEDLLLDKNIFNQPNLIEIESTV